VTLHNSNCLLHPFPVKCFLNRIAVSSSIITECVIYPYRMFISQADTVDDHFLPLHLCTQNKFKFLCHRIECFKGARLVKKGETLEVGFGNLALR